MIIDMASSITAEEDNFLCLSAIITNVATKSVQVKFDKVFPPPTLAGTILQNKDKLNKLKAEGRLNSAQYTLLFPRAGATSSDTYDITLMILLIRNLSKTVSKPIGGFDCLPSDTEISDEADLARIKYYRNKICHSGNNKISLVDFNDCWKCVTEAIVRLGGAHFKTICEDVRRKIFKSETTIGFTTMDTSVLEDSLEIYRHQDSNFICSCHDSHQLELANWEKQDKLFVETTAVKEILKTLENQSTITVIGRPGAGKSVTIQHVALLLRNKDKYEIIPCASPSDIVTHFRRRYLQLFVLDDVCGKYTTIQTEVDMWLSHEKKIMNLLTHCKAKIIVASRLQVFLEDQFRRIQLFSRNSCDLSSDKYKLSDAQRSLIVKNNCPNLSSTTPCSKVLPIHLFLDSSNIISPLFPRYPFNFFCEELDALRRQKDKSKYSVLFLFVVGNGVIDESFFVNDNYKKSELNQILEAFGCNYGTSMRDLQNHLDSFLLTYFKKEGCRYIPIHNMIFDYICAYFGEKETRATILHADSKVLCQRSLLRSLKRTDHDCAINVNEENESLYFGRIVQDISKRKINDVFCNHQMNFPEFRLKLMSVLKQQRDIKLLVNSTDEIDNVSPLYLACSSQYIDLIQFLLSQTNDINSFDEQLPLNIACRNGFENVVNLLIGNNADVNKKDTNGVSCLLEACTSNNCEIVEKLLYEGADINTTNEEGCTPLMYACYHGHIKIVDLLLLNGAVVKKRNINGWSSFMYACRNAHLEIVNRLISYEDDINYTNIYGASALLIACYFGHRNIVERLINAKTTLTVSSINVAIQFGYVEIITLLLKHGATINDDHEGLFPFIMAVSVSNIKIVRLLLKKGADVNYKVLNSNTALVEACKIGDSKLVKYLIDNGAKVNLPTSYGVTPLMVACMEGNFEIFNLLLQKGAHIDVPTLDGWTLLFNASQGGNFEIVKTLLNNKFDSNTLDKNGNTPLHVACFYGNIAAAIHIIANGADVKKQNKRGYSPLIVTGRTGNEWCVNLLVDKHGAPVDQVDKSGCTALMHACSAKHQGVVNLLLKKGADVHNIDICGWNAIMWACFSGHVGIVELLLTKLTQVDYKDVNGCTPLMIASYMGHHKTMRILIDNGASINIKDNEEWDPLMWACRGKNRNAIELLIQKLACKNVFDNGGTPLIWACESGEDWMVDLLLDRTYHTDDNLLYAWTRLMWASRKGDIKVVKALLGTGVNVNKANNDGLTPLILAICNGNTDISELLVKKGADINQTDHNGWSPLQWSDQVGTCTRYEFLGEHEALTSCINKEETFIWACKTGHNILVDSLIHSGIDVNYESTKNRTPLLEACKGGHYYIVKLLIKNKADANKADINGVTPLIETCKFGHLDIFQIFQLIVKRVNINATDKRRNSALSEASKGGYFEIVKKLIENGAVIIPNSRKWTATDEARLRGFPEIVTLIHDKFKLK